MTITIGNAANVEAWLAAEERIKQGSQQPEGSLTTLQYAELMGCSHSQARRRLRSLVIAGEATRTHFRAGNQSGAAWAYILNEIPKTKRSRKVRA